MVPHTAITCGMPGSPFQVRRCSPAWWNSTRTSSSSGATHNHMSDPYRSRYRLPYAGGMDIRSERIAAGMSQSELARAARVPQPNLSAYENGRRNPSPEVRERIARALRTRPSSRLEKHRSAIRDLVRAHHAAAPRVFGSVARGEDEADSDIDLLVEFTDEASLLDEVGLRLALQDLLQVEVDVVAVDTLHGEFRDRALKEAVPV